MKHMPSNDTLVNALRCRASRGLPTSDNDLPSHIWRSGSVPARAATPPAAAGAWRRCPAASTPRTWWTRWRGPSTSTSARTPSSGTSTDSAFQPSGVFWHTRSEDAAALPSAASHSLTLSLSTPLFPPFCVPCRNEPEITFAECKCFIPCNPCALDVIDHVEVLYFDRWVLLHLISSRLVSFSPEQKPSWPFSETPTLTTHVFTAKLSSCVY